MFKKTKSKILRSIAMHLVLLLSFQAAFPTQGFALTSGPSQPEFSSFEPATTTEMVDLFSGDFTYNIPLFELPGPDGGYPFNLAYNSGVGMDQEASWVGLGWTLNPGAINRNLRGLPDDFNGDVVTKRTDMLTSETRSYTVKGHLEFFGYSLDEFKKKIPNEDENNGGLKLALSASHNNYTGWGLGVNLGFDTPRSGNFYGGLDLGINSMQGASLRPSVGLTAKKDDNAVNFNLGFGINSREGLEQMSLGTPWGKSKTFRTANGGLSVTVGAKLGYSHNFARTMYIPRLQSDKRGKNTAPGYELGWWAGTNNLGVGVDAFFSEESEAFPNIPVGYKGYGYLHSKNLRNGERAILDFNREKSGYITDNTTNLSIPLSSPDVFMVQGQGTGGTFRAHRSDLGTFSDPAYKSRIAGKRLDLELGIPAVPPGIDIGIGLGGNWSNSKNKKWSSIQNIFQFDNNKSANSDYESAYFKGGSEHTAEPESRYDNVVNDEPIGLQLFPSINPSDPNTNGDLPPNLIFLDSKGIPHVADGAEDFKRGKQERKPRSNNLQPLTNEELLIGGVEGLNEYKIKYFNYDPATSYLDVAPENMTALDRVDNFPAHHLAGFTALQPTGLRYVYGLPVRNFSSHEIQFSLDPDEVREPCMKTTSIPLNQGLIKYKYAENSDNYINERVTPQYNSTHLLTSVLGSDYIDLDTIAGPSDGDYGYWVKFNYAKIGENYRWKAPFAGANFVRNGYNSARDDRAALSYGNKEQYYMATAETRTHIAVFNIKERADGKGAPNKYFNGSSDEISDGASSYLLHQIDLYSKLTLNEATPTPIKSVKMEYDYSLCKGVPNNDTSATHKNHNDDYVNNTGGKLTLKKLWFTYENSQRGKLSPYQFNYAENPDYNTHNYDRWGNYQNYDPDSCDPIDAPYTTQNTSTANENASAWSLKKISMPSGSDIKINYESDDYAYVQSRRAMRMFKIANASAGFGNAEDVPTRE